MKLPELINDLLYRYDCVIIPNFGGFITNKIGAKIDKNTHIFYPPMKQITFNSYLQHNDGLLANHISGIENISFEEAKKFIDEEVKIWNTKLHIAATPIILEDVGSLFLNAEKQLCFEPEKSANFLIESFGLSGVSAYERFENKAEDQTKDTSSHVISLPIKNQGVSKKEENEESSKDRRIPPYIKYVAGVAILMTSGVVGFRAYKMNQDKLFLTQQQEQLEQKIQEATFIIESPLPTIDLSVTKSEPSVVVEPKKIKSKFIKTNEKSYHIIAGAFRSKENAIKKVKQLKKQGFNASIVGKNKWDLVQVAYESFSTNEEGKNALREIRKTTNQESWMLVK